jgi:hypothetical protein
MGRIRQVREKDGTLSPYRERKVAESIHRALRESGSDDRALADELAGVVSLFLERTHQGEAPPLVADVEDTVERVLQETGNEAAAQRFRKARREREELRENVVVRGAARLTADALDPVGDGPAAAATSAWSRSRLSRSLQESLELPAALAEEVASEVEKKLFGLRLKSLSADLVRHLVECVLFERGIETGARAGERVPISVRSLTDDLFAPRDDGRPSPEAGIAAAVLEHFALAEIHGAAVVEAHARGFAHVHGLDRPLAVESLDLPWRLAVRDGAEGSRALVDLVRTLARVRPHVAGAIALPDAVPAAGGIDDLLDVVADAAPIEIGVPLDTPGTAVERIAARVAALPEGMLRVRFSGPVSGAASDRAFELMRQNPFAYLDLEERAPSPRPDGAAVPLAFSLARVTLNLPMLLANSSGEPGNEALAGLDRGAKAALAAFRERAWVQRKGPRSGLPAIVDALGGPGRVAVPASGPEADVEVWGLGHALGLLVGRGLIARGAASETAARILGRVLYALGEEQDGIQLAARISGCASRVVRKRMLLACEKTARKYGIRDLIEELRDGRSVEGALPVVAPLEDRRNKALLGSGLSERLGLGLGLPEACLPGGSLSGSSIRALRESSRLRSLHLAPPGSGEPFEVQEELFG